MFLFCFRKWKKIDVEEEKIQIDSVEQASHLLILSGEVIIEADDDDVLIETADMQQPKRDTTKIPTC